MTRLASSNVKPLTAHGGTCIMVNLSSMGSLQLLFRPSKPRTLAELVQQWDSLAVLRAEQLDSSLDLSYFRVLVPSILNLIADESLDLVLDAGCGVGALTPFLNQAGASVLGVDPSLLSIEEARKRHGHLASFEACTIEEFASGRCGGCSVVVANMVLMDTPDASSFVNACRRALGPGGALIATITHPCFWPIYKGYSTESWFHYEEEIFVEAPFTISLDRSVEALTTHVHRPLETYLEILIRAGFLLEGLYEPGPPPDVRNIVSREWELPHFLALRARMP